MADSSDYAVHLEWTDRRTGKTRRSFRDAGNIVEAAVAMAMAEAAGIEEEAGVASLFANGKWAASFGPGGWVHLDRPPRANWRPTRGEGRRGVRGAALLILRAALGLLVLWLLAVPLFLLGGGW